MAVNDLTNVQGNFTLLQAYIGHIILYIQHQFSVLHLSHPVNSLLFLALGLKN